MSDVLKAVVNMLASDAAVSSSVGSRVYYDRMIQNAPLPAISVTLITRNRNDHLTGTPELSNANVQVDIYSNLREEASRIRDEVAASLIGHRGDSAGTWIDRVTHDEDQDDFTPPDDRSDAPRFRCSDTYDVAFHATPIVAGS